MTAGVKISVLPTVASLMSSDIFPLVHSSVSGIITSRAPFSMLPFSPAGAGAVTRTVPDKLRDIVALADFGTSGEYDTAKSSLTGTLAFPNIDFIGGTWTQNSNVVWTRAIGVAPAGTTLARDLATTFSGDPGGTTSARGIRNIIYATGTQNVDQMFGQYTGSQIEMTAGTLTSAYGHHAFVYKVGNAALTNGVVYDGHFASESTVAAGTVTIFNIASSVLNNTAGATNIMGFRASSGMGHATKIQSAWGFRADDIDAAIVSYGFYSGMNSTGSGSKWAVHCAGTANSFFEAPVRWGATTLAANNAQNVTVGNVGPAGSALTILEWFKVLGTGGAVRYVPMFG